MTGRVRDGVVTLERALGLDGGDVAARAQTCNGLAALSLASGDASAAAHLHREALETFAALGDASGQGWSWIGLSMAALRIGSADAVNLDEAMGNACRAIEVFAGSANRRGVGHAHVAAGLVAARQRDSEGAESHFLHALAAFRLGRHRRDAVAVLANLGNLANDRGELLRAARFLDGAHQLAVEIGDRRGAGLVLNYMCLVAKLRGDDRQAEAFARAAPRAPLGRR